MRKISVLLMSVLVSGLFLGSCSSDNSGDTTDSNESGQLKVDFDGKTFVSTSVQAIVTDSYVAITGLRSTGGDIVQITLPSNKVGTYTWSSVSASGGVMALAYVPNDKNTFVSYSQKDADEEEVAGYKDNATVTITSIDATTKKISGTFEFTGIRFAANSKGETKVLSKGTFTNITYSGDTATQNGNTFSAKIDGTSFVTSGVRSIATSGKINIIGRKGSIENIAISVPAAVNPGTYEVEALGQDYILTYIENSSSEGIFQVLSGTIVIINNDTTKRTINGTFKGSFKSPLTSKTHEITDGAFSVSY